MANKNPVRYDIPFSMRVDQEFLETVDLLRAQRRPIPGRAELIREAVEKMLERERPKRTRS